MVFFEFYFWTIYRNNFKMWVFKPIVFNLYQNQTNTMSCFPNAIGPRLLKVIIHSYRIVFWSFICIFAYIPNPL